MKRGLSLALFFLSLSFCFELLAAESAYEWTGDECVSDSGDSAFVGRSCVSDSSCPDDMFCVNAGLSDLPVFCSFECLEDNDCGHLSACRLVDDELALSICIPRPCGDDEDWPEWDECNAKLVADGDVDGDADGDADGENFTGYRRKVCKTVCDCDHSGGMDYYSVGLMLLGAFLFFVFRLRRRTEQ